MARPGQLQAMRGMDEDLLCTHIYTYVKVDHVLPDHVRLCVLWDKRSIGWPKPRFLGHRL